MAERSLDSAPNYVPRTIQELLSELSTIRDVSVRSSKLDDFLKRLEEEMRKIYVFKRELPISIVLIKDAITTLKEESIQMMRGKHVKPVLEQFIPLTKIPDEVDDEDDDDEDGIKKEKDNKDKKNWLRSAQLWKTDDFSSSGKRHNNNNNPDSRTTKNAEFGFHPYHSSKNKSGSRTFMSIKGYPFFSAAAAAAARHELEDADEPISNLSLIMPGTKNSKELNRPKAVHSRSSSSPGPTSQLNLQAGMTSQPLHHQHRQQQNNNGRKQRRCWSQELHRRFLNALQQLGGSQASTPKQIRELMQVDNLTNDEVKSHLQKYRLHTKRAPDSSIKAPISNLGESSSMARDEYKVDSSKQSNSQSGSPQGPLDLSGTGGNNNSMEVGDEISESYSWKNQLHRRSAQDDDDDDDEEEEGGDGEEEDEDV